MNYASDSNVNVLVGLVLTSAIQEGSDRMVLKAECGRSFLFYHSQDCCESVNIDDIEGHLDDLVGEPPTKEQVDSMKRRAKSFIQAPKTHEFSQRPKRILGFRLLSEETTYTEVDV